MSPERFRHQIYSQINFIWENLMLQSRQNFQVFMLVWRVFLIHQCGTTVPQMLSSVYSTASWKKNPKQCLNLSLVKREKPPQKQSTMLEYLQQVTQQAHHKRFPATLCMYYSRKTSSMRDTQQSISFGLSLTARKPVLALQALNASSCITTTAAKYSSLPCGVQTKELRKPLA